MRRTILLADDSPTIRRLVTQTFADANFRLVEVNNGDAAIRSFEEVRPDVVLADIYMPGRNGYQVCSYIRGHSELGRTPVVLLVGAFEAFDEDTANQAGATASITKPFEPAALIELVKSIMPTRTVAREHEPEHETVAQPRTERAEPHPAPVLAEPVQPKTETVQPHPVEVRLEQVQVPVAPVDSESFVPPPRQAVPEDPEDLLGLELLFPQETPTTTSVSAISPALTEEAIDRIVDRVIRKLSTQVIESIAWDVVPDITEKIVREELKRVHES
jgi:CheY-like chemotaxis protein